MLSIERLRMRLPPGFEHRASAIAGLVGESMAEFQSSQTRALDRLSIGRVQISPHATDQEIARGIAERIASRLRGSL